MRQRLTSALIPAALALASLPVAAQAAGERFDYWAHGWGWGHVASGALMMVLFWGGIVVLIVLAGRWLGGGASQVTVTPAAQRTPREILQERFARGEIDEEEFEDRQRLLS